MQQPELRVVPSEALKIIENGDLLEIALLLNTIDKVQKEYLIQTAKHSNSSVLSLLLSHPSSQEIKEVNEVMVCFVEHSDMSLIRVLLQFNKISFESANLDRIVTKTLEKGNKELLLLLLTDKRFKPSDPLSYVLYTLKCKNSIDMLGILFGDTRFVVPTNSICKVMCEAVLDMNIVLYLIDALPKGHITSKCVIKAIKSGNECSFISLLSEVDNRYYPAIIQECFYSGRIGMFKLLVNKLPLAELREVYKLCFVNEDEQRLELLMNMNKLVEDAKLLCSGLYDVNQSSRMFDILIDTHNISLCDDTECFISFLLKNRYDSLALHTMTTYKNRIFCKHVEDFISYAVETRCMKSVHYLLNNGLCILSDKVKERILSMKDEKGMIDEVCIESMLKRASLDHALIYKYLENKEYFIIDAISRHSTIDLFWSNYALLRLAAKDKTSNSYDALYGRLNFCNT